MPAADRLAHQELLRALAGLVVVVDDAVVGGLVAIELLGFAAGGERREQHVDLRCLPSLPSSSPANRAPRRNRRAAPCAGNRRRRSRCGSGRRSPGAGPGCAARSRRCSGRAARPCRRPPRLPCACGDSRCPCCATSTATYLPVSESATTASIAGVAGDDDAHRLHALCRPRPACSRMRSFWPSLQAAVAAARAERRDDRLDLVGRAPRSRRIVATDSPFLTVMVRSFQALPPVACAAVFGSSVMFSGTMRVSKPA